jgi:hypothetical protein
VVISLDAKDSGICAIEQKLQSALQLNVTSICAENGIFLWDNL